MLALKPKPTFKVGVTIHTPGEDDAKVTFEFKHKGRKELKAFFESFANADKPADAAPAEKPAENAPADKADAPAAGGDAAAKPAN